MDITLQPQVNPHNKRTLLQEYQEFTPTTIKFDKKVSLQYLITGISGEAGEVCSAYAKWVRGDYDSVERDSRLTKELGDIMWFVSNLCHELNITMEELIEKNTTKLSKRLADNTIKGDGETR